MIQENFDIQIVEREDYHQIDCYFELCQSDKVFDDMPHCENYIKTTRQEKIADIGIAWSSHHLTFEKKSVDPEIFLS